MIARLLALLVAVASGLAVDRAQAQESFYNDKTIRIIVGSSAGGGYDAYARLIGRHLGKYIPGNPAVIVDNMPGAGSLIAANYIYKAAKPDGLTMAHFIGGMFLQQLLGKAGVEFDARKFEYVGVPLQDHFVIAVAKSSGITNFQQWHASKTPVRFGGQAPGSGADDIPNALKSALGLPLQVIDGYKGAADVRLAMIAGEVHAFSNGWESMRATWGKDIESGAFNILLQVSQKPHADLPKVPVAFDHVKTDEGRKLLQVVTQAHGASVRPIVLPPGTPKDRVQTLRNAFTAALKDPELKAEAAKARLEINPLTGDELGQRVGDLFKTDAALLAKLKEVLK